MDTPTTTSRFTRRTNFIAKKDGKIGQGLVPSQKVHEYPCHDLSLQALDQITNWLLMPYPHFPATTKSKRFYLVFWAITYFASYSSFSTDKMSQAYRYFHEKYVGELHSLVSSAENSAAKTWIVISIKLNNIHSIHIPFVRMLYSEVFPRQEPFNCVDSPQYFAILTSSSQVPHIIFISYYKLHSVTFIVFLMEFMLGGH